MDTFRYGTAFVVFLVAFSAVIFSISNNDSSQSQVKSLSQGIAISGGNAEVLSLDSVKAHATPVDCWTIIE